MSVIQFTPDQNRAIESVANMVITACPGSGKTSIIVEKIIREVKGLKSYQGIIGITFTVKASKELKRRCKSNGVDTKASFFGTIDHFCLSEIIYPFISRIYGTSAIPLQCKLYNDLDNELQVGLPDLSITGNELKTEDYNLYEQNLKALYAKGIILLESLGVLSIYIINNSIGCRNYIKSKYMSLYVDEYQDSSEPQHKLFMSLLHLGLKSVAVGDTQQSIYAWRGCDPKYIQDLIAKPDVFEHHIVNINHRCHTSINNYANRLFNEQSILQPTDEIRVYHWFLNGTQLNVAQQINKPINEMVERNLVSSLSEVAILVRNNSSLEFVKNGLTIPFRVYIDDPLSAVNTHATKVMSGLLSYYFDAKSLVNDTFEIVEQIRPLTIIQRNEFRNIIKALRLVPQDQLMDKIIDKCQSLIDMDITESEKNALECTLADDSFLKQYKPIDKNEVQVMTLHKSKGLEFESVFHLDLYDWIFPRRRYTGNFNEEVFYDWAQELNLHFVGITRSKKYCFLVSSNQRINSNNEIKNGKKSQFMTLPSLNGLYR